MYARICLVVIIAVLLGICDPAGSAGAVTQWTYEDTFDLRIPADPATSKGWMVDAVLDVPDHITIEDLDVSVSLTHTCVFDLQLFLTDPSGGTVVLNYYGLSDYFEGENYEQTVFDDEALVSIQDATAPFTGRFRPVESLAAFDGQDAYGSWALRIYDGFAVDSGQLETFGLTINTTAVPEPTTTALTLLGLGLVRLSTLRRSPGRSSRGLLG